MMIVKKSWERLAYSRWSPRERSIDGRGNIHPQYHDTYTGWFLFGLLPLFISRSRTPLKELRDRV